MPPLQRMFLPLAYRHYQKALSCLPPFSLLISVRAAVPLGPCSMYLQQCGFVISLSSDKCTSQRAISPNSSGPSVGIMQSVKSRNHGAQAGRILQQKANVLFSEEIQFASSISISSNNSVFKCGQKETKNERGRGNRGRLKKLTSL